MMDNNSSSSKDDMIKRQQQQKPPPPLSSEKIVYLYDFLQEGETVTTTKRTETDLASSSEESTRRRRRIAFGQAVWCEAFWLPVQQRKHPNYNLSIIIKPSTEEQDSCSMATTAPKFVVTIDNDDDDEEETAGANVDWNKLIQIALKKVHVEDLGDLAGNELFASIPVEDKEGRGQNDLEAIQKQLSVKVVWLFNYDPNDNHVLLVGNETKLEKKCLVLRNILAHYFWRLKGKQINL